MPKTWFRVHAGGPNSIIDNKKLQRLQPSLFKWVVNLWALGCEKEGILPSPEDIAWRLHESEGQTRKALEELTKKRFLDHIDGVLTVHEWAAHQFEVDSSTLRVREYRRKLAESGSSPAHFQKFRPMVLERDSYSCVYCASQEKLVVDHVVPVSRGGWTDIDNLVTACRRCNSGKAGRTPEEAGLTVLSEASKKLVTAAVMKWRDKDLLVAVTETDLGDSVTSRVRASESESESVRSGSFVSSEQKNTEVTVTPGHWEEYISIFLLGGKELNEEDLKECRRFWDRLPIEERIAAVVHAKTLVIETDTDFLPFPVNHLRKKPWTRRGPGRLIPEPQKLSKAAIGQSKAAAEFLAEEE